MTEQFKRVGEYRLIKRIGKGATSQVYQAKKQGNNDRFAVKMIRLKGLNAQQKQIVTKQVNIIKSINHPNIVHLIQTFQTTNNFYLVFEYCQRGDLQKFLAEFYGPRLPQETAQRIIYCIADAVSLIHSKGIAHRDLKLANILLKKDYQIKLADFGFAKQQSKKMLMETYCGTPITMAPQIMQNKPYDKKVDIWSLGVITFQLIYGKLPFSTSEGLPKFMQYVTEQPLQIPSQPPMTSQFKQLLMCSLEKNPQKRFSIKQFLSNKWVQQGSQNSVVQTGLKKRPSVEQLLKNVSQQIKHEQINMNSDIEILVAQRVNKLIVTQLHKIMKRHVQIRQNLLSRVKDQQSMKNLLFKLDYSFIDYLKNLPLRIGKQSSTQIIKSEQLQGVQFPKPLVSENPVCDTAGNVIFKYLQKAAHQVYNLQQKLKMYQLAYQFLQLTQRFDLRIIVLFANHLYEDFQVGNVITNIKEKKIYEQISEDVEFTKGNYITLAMECQDKDSKMKNVRQTLRKNIRKRIDEIKKQIGGF